MTEDERELQDSIFKAAKAPQEKYKWPMTANQMIGWSWKDAAEFREDDKKGLATHAQSEIVKYNENYVLAFGKSPFARWTFETPLYYLYAQNKLNMNTMYQNQRIRREMKNFIIYFLNCI